MEMKSLLVYPLLKSFVPLLIGGSYHILKEISSSGTNINFSHDDDPNKKIYDGNGPLKTVGMSSEEIPFDFVTSLNQISFGIYENFFTFLLVMLLIDVICKIAKNGSQGFWRETKSFIFSRKECLNSSRKKFKVFKVISKNHMMKRILSYALIFSLFQIVEFCLSSSYAKNDSFTGIRRNSQSEEETFSHINMITNHQEEEDYFGFPRILSEDIQDNELISSPISSSSSSLDKISLSMRNVLSSLNINVNSMVLSKDRKTAYATLEIYGTLKIIDISDLRSPGILGSLNLKNSVVGFRIKSLALSADEKTLYASNSRELEIVDITDPTSPKLISFTPSEIFSDKYWQEVSEYFRTSLAFSERTKTLYIAGQGLQVYDVSNQDKPVLLKAIKNGKGPNDNQNPLRNELLRNEICLSRDEQILFIANGALDIYNVSNPRDLKQLNSLKTESEPRSLLLSDDEKTIFLLGRDANRQLLFEEVEILNLRVQNTIHLGYSSRNSPRFLAASPNKSKFFIFANSEAFDQNIGLLVFDRIKQATTQIEKSLMEETFVMIFSPDGRTLITGSNNQFLAIELYLDYPNSRIFSESSKNYIANFSLPSLCQNLQISHDGKYLFTLRNNENPIINISHSEVFEVWDVSNASAPYLLGSSLLNQSIFQVYFAENYETVYLRGDKSINILDISNPSSITEKRLEAQGKILDFIASSDGKTGFLLMRKEEKGFLTFINLSSGSEGFVTLDREFGTFESYQILKDDKTLIVLDEEIFIYNISDLHSPVPIASLPYGLNETKPRIDSYTLSPDKKTLFILTSDRMFFSKLGIYNISDVSSPFFIGEKYFSKKDDQRKDSEFSFPRNSQSGFLYQTDSFIKLNMADLKKPAISGLIPLNSGQIRSYAISPDGQTIYTAIGNEIQILNVNIEYTLYLNKEKYLLGEKYSNKISMLRRSGKSDYDLLESKSYKIITLSLLDIQIAPNKFSLEKTISPLPSWISLDMHSNKLTVEPKKQSELGSYILHSAFSLKVPVDVFNGSIIGKDGKPMISENLIAWLISLDYLDNQLFLTENFGSLETFFLPDQFLDYKEEIHSILKRFYIETCTMFDVISSLELNEKSLMVSTLSTNEIHVEITLEPREESEVKFVNRPYGGLLPLIRENKTKAVLEGTLDEINFALKSVVVNFENGVLSDASVVIRDGLNPPLFKELSQISRCFKVNKPPRINNNTDHQTLQEQIDIADIQTGKYFTYTLSNDIFEDDYAESLNYEMTIDKNNTAFPSWLSFSGLTLKGTPPEELFGRDLDLILIAKNEFKQFEVPFKLHIRISAVFCMKMLLRYSPYILTFLGLLVSANKIFNILAKKKYKHPKEYQLNVGEEISPENIFPILFVKEEKTQSRLILKHFKRHLTDFIDPITGILDKQRIIERIKEVVQEMPKRIPRYPSSIIDQMVINKFVLMQLDSDVKTKFLFEDLKSKCLEIVESDPFFGFVINQNQLSKKIEQQSSNDIEENLIPGVNVELLKDAILAYAFECHSLDLSPVQVRIGIKQQVPSRFLFNFLKLNLKDISFNHENKIDYGINYRIIDDKLIFYGKVESYFAGKTLAVQIKNKRQKILKEIWIHGGAGKNMGQYEIQDIYCGDKSYAVY